MSLDRRHMGGMHMGSSSMSMGASMTSGMSMQLGASMTSGMSMPLESGMSMGHMDGMTEMHMFFTTAYNNYPVLFKDLKAKNGGQAFGIFLLLFVVGILLKGLEFLRNYLEQVVWKNPVYLECHPGESAATKLNSGSPVTKSCCGDDGEKNESENTGATVSNSSGEDIEDVVPKPHIRLVSSLMRDAIRLALCIIPEIFGFALMLATMSFTLTYFFAVVLGLGIGRFIFDKLSDSLLLKPIGPQGGMHC